MPKAGSSLENTNIPPKTIPSFIWEPVWHYLCLGYTGIFILQQGYDFEWSL